MLQIRLNKDSSAEAGGGGLKLSGETVTVACPDHLVLADLPVAKSLGVVSAASVVKAVGRRSRRQLGERVHFCVRCDFPIAIYGRLTPCEHAFCLDCARSDSICYLCEERIQKIQTIKMMEGIFVCAAPHCLKSFLKRDEFESHVHETHSNLLQPNVVKEEGNDPSVLESTARAPSRTGFSPGSNSQLPYDRQQQPRPQFFGQMPNRPSEPQPNYAVPITPNFGQNAPPGFNHTHFQSEGAQQIYNGYEMQRQDSIPEGGFKQGSLLGYPPGQAAVGMNFPSPYSQQWNAAGAGVPFAPPPSSQGYPDAFMNMADSQGGPASSHGGFGQQGSSGTS